MSNLFLQIQQFLGHWEFSDNFEASDPFRAFSPQLGCPLWAAGVHLHGKRGGVGHLLAGQSEGVNRIKSL